MGRGKRRENLERVAAKAKAHKDLVIFTALLMGAEFKQPYFHEKAFWVSTDGLAHSYSRFECARVWLWRKGMSVRNDGSIYENKNLTSEERHHVP